MLRIMCICAADRRLAFVIFMFSYSVMSAQNPSDDVGIPRFVRSLSPKPEIVERPVSQSVHVNQSATFVCRPKSSLSSIAWTKNGLRLGSLPGFLLVADGSLTFLRVQKSDGGIYKCVVKNEAGTSSAEATLTVLDALVTPVITYMTANQTIVEGERATFTCKATGNPPPLIRWEISLESAADTQPERPSPDSIRIASATPRDSGEYRCIASNKQGNDTGVRYLNVLGYPVFLLSPPPNKTVPENTTVVLDCKVIGSPAPEVRWYYGNRPVSQGHKLIVLTNNTLILSRVNFEEAGSYTCVANNSAGLRRSKTTLLRVLRRPTLLCCPDSFEFVRNQTGIKGKPGSLNCSVAGYPEPRYDWRFENKTVSQSSVLTIPSVFEKNEGVYSCRAYNNLGSLLVKIFLSVLVPPTVLVQPERRVVVAGDSAEFMCAATGDPIPEISWYSASRLISRNKSLVIANVSSRDQAEYHCEAKSAAGQMLAKGTLVVAVKPAFEVVPPYIVTGNETSSVRIHCIARGPDKPVITWDRLTVNGKKKNISVGGRISLFPGILEISHVAKNDTGFYSCEAKNLAGLISTNFSINVQYRPHLIVSEQNVSIMAGKAASLHCPIQANPAAQVQWIHPAIIDGQYFLIAKVNASHAGQYICVGVNVLGQLRASLLVTVLGPPEIIGLTRVDKKNNWISLTCEVRGFPAPVIRSTDQAHLPSGSFTIHLGSIRVDKRYVNKMSFLCNASNAYGWSAKYVKVPSTPSKLNVTRARSSSITLSWSKNDSEIIDACVVERMSKTQSVWVVINSSVALSEFTDLNLLPFTWFLFRVSALNVLGTSDPSETVNITTLEGVPSPPSGLAAVSRELTSITLEWKPPRQPKGHLTNILYELYYQKYGASSQIKKVVNNSLNYRVKVPNLRPNTLYVVKVRAGRRLHDSIVHWSEYASVEVQTLQEAPTFSPELKASSNGPRRIYVSWKAVEDVDGYELDYGEYEAHDVTTKVIIKPWSTTNYMITGLTPSTYYQIRLRLFTSGGHGPWTPAPVVLTTGQDRLALPGPISSSSDDLPWKIAVGGSALAVVLLLLLLLYMYLVRKSKQKSDSEQKHKACRKKGNYDFDNTSRESNESEGSVVGIYNVNVEHNIDLSMFDHSHHSGPSGVSSSMYVENPILPSDQAKSDDGYEAVRLATFTARSSPLPTPGGSPILTGRRQMCASEVNPAYQPDFPEPPVYAKVDLAAKRRERRETSGYISEETNDDVLI